VETKRITKVNFAGGKSQAMAALKDFIETSAASSVI
jgi:hypothetical protein